jgi:DNA-binding response OmpR family regulator
LAILLTLKAVLEMNGFQVETACSASEAAKKLKSGNYQMVITDMRMESATAGYDVIRAARALPTPPATAILTAYPNLSEEWREYGAQHMLVKPMNTGDLLRQIEALLVSHQDALHGPEKLAGLGRRPVRSTASARKPHLQQVG